MLWGIIPGRKRFEKTGRGLYFVDVILIRLKRWALYVARAKHSARRPLFHILATILLLSSPLHAQPETYPFNFAYLSTDNGLPHNYCHTALRDSRGFLWFGTQDGLARYDGVAFKTYAYRGDSTGLSAPTVLDLDEDRRGFLWIATAGGGLNRFDPVSETFAWFQNDPLDPASLRGNDLSNVLIDAEDAIWVGGLSTGLSRFDPASGRFTNYSLAQNLTTAEDRLHRNSVQDIAADSEDPAILWLAAHNGIFRFDKRNGQLQHYPAETPCRDVQADTPGTVWVATEGGGIARFDKKTAHWTWFPSLPAEWARRNPAANLIGDISWKSGREFWVASLDQGFGIFDINTGKYTFFNSQAKLLAGQSGQSVNGLYRDPSGLLWVFNYKNGISLLDPANNVLDYTPMPGEGCQNPKMNEPLDFAWNEARKELYVVSAGCRGLYVFEPVARVAPVQLSGQSPYRLKYAVPVSGTTAFRCILTDAQGQIWIGAEPGTKGYSLYRYLPERRRLEPYQPGSAIHRFPVNALAQGQEQDLWAATTGGGLFNIGADMEQHLLGGDFDGARMEITGVFCRPAQKNANASGKPQVWLATREAGVFRFENGQFVRYGYRRGARQGLAENNIAALTGDAQGNIWVGTASQGLQQIPADAGPDAVFPHFTVKNGLAFNSIHRLTMTGDGRLCISTEKGVSVFSPENSTFKTFDESDGLADTYLQHKGLRWCGSGEIFVGQTKGFYSLRLNNIYENTEPPVLAFTGFRVFDKPYSTGKDLNFLPEVRLRHDQNFFTIQFAALNFSQAGRNQYFYRIEGIDPQWVASGNRAEATYTKVPPGKYVFELYAQNYSGVRSAKTIKLFIVVEPAFYQTWWFRILLLALFTGAVVQYFRGRLDRILKQAAANNELNRLRAVKAELENKALRAQMNPHFIFNALNTIEEKPEAASALLQKFSKLVRLVLENSREPRVSLTLELEALELYLQLEVIRMDGRFRYQIEVDAQLERQRCQIPPLILQPFVENAILHGLRHLQGRDGLLKVQIGPETSAGGIPLLHCRIRDNGIGRARAAEINARTRISEKKQSLGVKLTTERVELLNTPGRKDYRVEISDIAGENGAGTVVDLFLPLETS
ncbi:MAG: histidine kinase [Thermoanaerobaculia bacterium]|nr:histidine kinase [Thermoanaerobaculia bacterium]